MKEQSANKMFQKWMQPFGMVLRIESRTHKGIPDIYYCIKSMSKSSMFYPQAAGHKGWIETKYLEDWPRGYDTPVCIRSLTLEQVLWHEEHRASGGVSWLFLQVSREYFLLPAALHLRPLYERRTTRDDLVRAAQDYAHGRGGFPLAPVVRCLTRG